MTQGLLLSFPLLPIPKHPGFEPFSLVSTGCIALSPCSMLLMRSLLSTLPDLAGNSSGVLVLAPSAPPSGPVCTDHRLSLEQVYHIH